MVSSPLALPYLVTKTFFQSQSLEAVTTECYEYIRHFAKDIMSALLSADAPLTEEERNDLLAQEQALKKELRQVRAKLGKEKNGMYTALSEAVDKAPVLSGGATENMKPPTAEELKPSDAEIAGNAMLDEIDEKEMEKHYQKVYDYTIALKASCSSESGFLRRDFGSNREEFQ